MLSMVPAVSCFIRWVAWGVGSVCESAHCPFDINPPGPRPGAAGEVVHTEKRWHYGSGNEVCSESRQ